MKAVKTTALLVFLLLASFIYAAPPAPDDFVSDLTGSGYLHPKDLSLNTLWFIFGDVVKAVAGFTAMPSQPQNVIALISYIFNIAMLFFVLIMAGYNGWSAVLLASRSGELHQKNYSTWSVFFRSTVALGALIPLNHGYSSFQIFIIWIMTKSIAVANAILIFAMQMVNLEGSIYSDGKSQVYANMAKEMYAARLCQVSINSSGTRRQVILEKDSLSSGLTGFFKSGPSSLSSSDYGYEYEFVWDDAWGSGNVCGEFEIYFKKLSVDENGANGAFEETVLKDYQTAYLGHWETLDAELTTLAVDTVEAYKNELPPPDTSRFVTAYNDFYNNVLAAKLTFLTAAAAAADDNSATSAEGLRKLRSEEQGWMYWGVFYFDLMRQRDNTSALENVDIHANGPQMTKNNAYTEDFNKIYNDYGVKVLSDADTVAGQDSGLYDFDLMQQEMEQVRKMDIKKRNVDGMLGTLDRTVNNMLEQAAMAPVHLLTSASSGPDVDPMTRLASVGQGLITYGTTLYVLLTTTISTIDGVETAADGVIDSIPIAGGFAIPVKAGASVIMTTAISFGGILLTAIASLIFFGIMLAYILPAQIFIQWIFAIFGWVQLVINTIIAAAMWLAAMARSEGEGVAGQHGLQGWMLMFNVFIRPSAMLIAGFAAIFSIFAMGLVVDYLFYPAIASISPSSNIILVFTKAYAYLAIYVAIYYGLVTRIASLITDAPEAFAKYFGGISAGALGEDNERNQSLSRIGGVTSGGGRQLNSNLDGKAVDRHEGKIQKAIEAKRGGSNVNAKNT